MLLTGFLGGSNWFSMVVELDQIAAGDGEAGNHAGSPWGHRSPALLAEASPSRPARLENRALGVPPHHHSRV